MKRIPFIDGTPTLAPMSLTVGTLVKEMIESDLDLEHGPWLRTTSGFVLVKRTGTMVPAVDAARSVIGAYSSKARRGLHANRSSAGNVLANLDVMRNRLGLSCQWALVHNTSMTDDSMKLPQDIDESRRAGNEAAERQMRLQVWLNGLLAGGPSLSEAVKPWREELSTYNSASALFPESENEVPEDHAKLAEEWLMAARRRIRERREQAGEPQLDICEEECKRRFTEVLEEVETGRCAGEEFTPMHVVLAARYIEGVIDLEGYRSRRKVIRTP